VAPIDHSGFNTWVVQYVLALVEIWALVAQYSGLVGAWRLTGEVCRAARAGAKECLGTLPGWIVRGGADGYGCPGSEVWRLNMARLQWGPMPALVTARYEPACCTVRGGLVVLGGEEQVDEITSKVETLSKRGGDGEFTSLPPLSFGHSVLVALAVEESDSPKGQVLLLGGCDENNAPLSTAHLVDLATGVCRPQPALLDTRVRFMAAQLPDGHVVCAGGCTSHA